MASEAVNRMKRRRPWIPNEPMDVGHLNKVMPIGTKVRFYPGHPDDGSRECEIRSEFMLSNSGVVVCFVTGQSGYVAASHVERIA